jgi:hypothetical protein
MENPQSYTHEFKAEAVKLVLNQGLSLREAAKRLSFPKGTLTNWVSNARGAWWHRPPGSLSAGTGGRGEADAKGLDRGPHGARHLKKSDGVFCKGRAKRRVPLQGTRS